MSLIPGEKVKPIIDALVESRGGRRELAEEIATAGAMSFAAAERRLYAIQSGESKFVRDDVVDNILCGADAHYLWHLHNEDEGARVLVAGGQPSYLPRHKVLAAHKLYLAGYSTGDLGKLMYRQFGYATAGICARSLVKRFRQLGLRRRNKSEAGLLRFRDKPCAACGVQPDERTPGCRPCNHRHWHRKVRNSPTYIEPMCRGCGCKFDERTRGCLPCNTRHWWRRKHNTADVELDRRCVGCGAHFNFRTPRCRQCTDRHSLRRRRAASLADGRGGINLEEAA